MNMHRECRKLVKDPKSKELKLELCASLNQPRNGHAIAVVGNSHLVVSGSRLGSGDSCEMYDIGKNVWNQLPSLIQGRYYHSSCTFDNEFVYVFCGIEHSTKKYINTIERLCVTDNGPAQWQNVEVKYGPGQQWPLLTPRQGLGSCQIDNSRIMLIGGFAQGIYTNESFYFDVNSSEVTKAPNVPCDIFPF
jgi:N-acetylneuraminic acid mutarotase